MISFAEPVIGRRFAPTRWLNPSYEAASSSSAALPHGRTELVLDAARDQYSSSQPMKRARS
jgi:hypothetical protein